MTKYLQVHLHKINLSLSLSPSDLEDKKKSFIDSLHVKWVITCLHSRNGKAKVSMHWFRKLISSEACTKVFVKVADKGFAASTNTSP